MIPNYPAGVRFRVHVEAGQAQLGDEFLAAGMLWRIVDVEHLPTGSVKITGTRVDVPGALTLRTDPEAPFEVIPPPDTYQPIQECDPL